MRIGPDFYLAVWTEAPPVVNDPEYVVSYSKHPIDHGGGVVTKAGDTAMWPPVVLCPAPSDEGILWHRVDFLSIDNRDSANADLSIVMYGGAMPVVLYSLQMSSGRHIYYTPQVGWRVFY